MKSLKCRIGVLVLAIASPGFAVLSCGGAVTRKFRDAAVQGGADFVQQEAFDLLDQWIPDPIAAE